MSRSLNPAVENSFFHISENSGGRALESVVRPYARATAGELICMSFEPDSRNFTLEFSHVEACTAPTELFIPNFQYPLGCKVTISDGTFEINAESQTLQFYHSDRQNIHQIRVTPL